MADDQCTALDYLKRIAADAERTRKAMEALALHLGAGRAPAAQQQTAGPRIAGDDELDGNEWGDKEIRKDPPRWKGDPHKGDRWSQCPADYLDALAQFLEWAAGKKREDAAALDGEEKAKAIKYAGYDEADAAKVRGWARRARERGDAL